MNWLECFVVGLKGLLVHKGRAALSMLGIIFGVGAVVAAVSVSLGAEQEFQKQLRAMGTNTIVIDWTVEKKRPETLVGRGLSVREVEALVAGARPRPKPGVRRAPRPKDVHVADLEARLSRALGTKVTVLQRGEGGRIAIDYYSLDELDGILARIGIE